MREGGTGTGKQKESGMSAYYPAGTHDFQFNDDPDGNEVEHDKKCGGCPMCATDAELERISAEALAKTSPTLDEQVRRSMVTYVEPNTYEQLLCQRQGLC